MAVKWFALRGPFTAGSWQALNGRQMATLKRAICDKKWLAMLPFLPFVALTETTNGPFMSCLLGSLSKSLFGLRTKKPSKIYITSWWHHQAETFSALLSLCAVTGEFPSQRPVTRSSDVFFDLCLKKRLSKQSWGWWFETPSRSLWCHCNMCWQSTINHRFP